MIRNRPSFNLLKQGQVHVVSINAWMGTYARLHALISSSTNPPLPFPFPIKSSIAASCSAFFALFFSFSNTWMTLSLISCACNGRATRQNGTD